MRTPRILAVGVTALVALSTLFLPTPAMAEGDPASAPDSPATPAAPAAELILPLEEAGVDLVAYGTNSKGELVVATGADSPETPEAETALAEFAERQGATAESTVQTEISGELEALGDSSGDLSNGTGYVMVFDNEAAAACSIGFAAWSEEGDPAILSAGHCGFNVDGGQPRVVLPTVPSSDPAAGGPGSDLGPDPVPLGNFSFVQFGGPGSTAGAGGDPGSIDIAVIEIADNFPWQPLPQVTDWTTPGATFESLLGSTVAVRSVGAPIPGPVSKSGRTTGFTTGVINADTDILDGWASVSGHWVRGFGSNTLAMGGDSGGPIMQGTTAVGITSGAATNFMWGASLVNSLGATGGYEVALAIESPAITSPAAGSSVQPGQRIAGTAPANASEIEILVPDASRAAGDPVTVPVNNGVWETTAPFVPGSYSYQLTAKSGFSESAPLSAQIQVDELLPPTVIDLDTDDPQAVLTGTGLPGASVSVVSEGEAVGSAVVSSEGTWNVGIASLPIGKHTVEATQSLESETSDPAAGTVTLRPVPPVITSFADGDVFEASRAPRSISGTGLEGAGISLTVNGAKVPVTVASGAMDLTIAADGTWAAELDAALAAGSHTITATHEVAGVTSAPRTVNIKVLAAPAPSPHTPAKALAATGGDSSLPFGVAGLGLLLVGGLVALVAARRRSEPSI